MRTLVLVASLAALVAVVLLSIGFGSNRLSLGEVLHALFAYDGSYNDVVVRDDRLPRTVLGLLVGMALGLAGSLMQAITRNPVAEPGLLGINHGAAVAIVLGSTVFSLTSPDQYIWFAFAGALVGTTLVAVIGGTRGATSPLRLVLAGVAIQAVFIGINQAMQMINTHNLQAMRFWLVGSLINRNLDQLSVLLPFFVAGVVIAVVLARALNALALGEDTARGLGANPALVRAAGMVAVGLLSAAATAACGPIAFVGLMIPHVVRSLIGQDERWVMLLSALLGPVLLLGCDILGRVAASPAEIQVGVMTDVVGGIAFVIVARRLKAVRR
ncbi:FecCD family ABC transporter permease [Amycolatopsis umgeniensis]|uniref:Iron complex transport system permease protein n=1 Tax=Amycolatopsis umgeniensis TaxID=336628 RepID=A0A841B5U8_9PSEU|nr:iron complex transport system permease protein [Amycolatopsis umgeniensis]